MDLSDICSFLLAGAVAGAIAGAGAAEVVVSGRTGYNSPINGVYKNNPQGVYTKSEMLGQTLDTKWVVYRASGKEWCITGVHDCGGNSRKAYAYASGPPDIVPNNGWHVWSGGKWLLDENVKVKLRKSDVEIQEMTLHFFSPADGSSTQYCDSISVNISSKGTGVVHLWSVIDHSHYLVQRGVWSARVLVGQWPVQQGGNLVLVPDPNLAFRHFGPTFSWLAELHSDGQIVNVSTTTFSCRFFDAASHTFAHEHNLALYDYSLVLEAAVSLGMSAFQSASSSKGPPALAQFGVFEGGTLAAIARSAGPVAVHGFDSFRGLPDSWWSYEQGSYAVDKEGVERQLARWGLHDVQLHAGWFNETAMALSSNTVLFIHADADLYSSTISFLEVLACTFVPGTVILFDEFFNYPGWQHHEFKAWEDIAARFGIGYMYLGFASQQSVPIAITHTGTGSQCVAQAADNGHWLDSISSLPGAIQGAYALSVLTWGTKLFLSDEWSAEDLWSWCLQIHERLGNSQAQDACHSDLRKELQSQWRDAAAGMPPRATSTDWVHLAALFRHSFHARRSGPFQTLSQEHGILDHALIHPRKLRVDREQLLYLQESDSSLHNVSVKLDVADQLLGNRTCLDRNSSILCRAAFKHVVGVLNRAHKVHECHVPLGTMAVAEFTALPGLRKGALNHTFDELFEERGYFVADDILEPKALECASSILFNSTIWYNWFPTRAEPHYWKTRADEGLHQELIYKLASDLQNAVPLLATLQYMWHWAYLYENEGTGIGVHADAFGINCNIYLTDTEANLAENSGGIELYFNGTGDETRQRSSYSLPRDLDKDLNMKRTLSEAGAGKVKIPYRKNRLVCFDSSLYHRTDAPLNFRPGWANRRTSLTFLFGHLAWRRDFPYQKWHSRASSEQCTAKGSEQCTTNLPPQDTDSDDRRMPPCQCDTEKAMWRDTDNEEWCLLTTESTSKDCIFIGTWQKRLPATDRAKCFLVTGTPQCLPKPNVRAPDPAAAYDHVLKTLRPDMADAALALRDALAKAGYAPVKGSATRTTVSLANGAFSGAWQGASEGRLDLERALPRRGRSDAADLMRLFLMGVWLSLDRVEALLPQPVIAMLREIGILIDVGPNVFSAVQIGPVGEDEIALITTDWIPGATGMLNSVMYLGQDSRGLAAATGGVVREKQPKSFLDICTGSGVQGIIAALHASKVDRMVFVDLNERAKRFVEFNLLLNNLRGEFLLGDIGTLSLTGHFDMVTGNPPYWPLPPSGGKLLFQNGGITGEDVTSMIVQTASPLLSSRGVMALVTPLFNIGQVEERLDHWWQGEPRSYRIFHSDVLSADDFMWSYGEDFSKKWRNYHKDGIRSVGIHNASMYGFIFAVVGGIGTRYMHVPNLWNAITGCPGAYGLVDWKLGEVCLRGAASHAFS